MYALQQKSCRCIRVRKDIRFVVQQIYQVC